MKKIYPLAIIGGGASGLFLSSALADEKILLLERADRVGKKLSATGNGQGNLTNLNASKTAYFSSSDSAKAQKIVQAYNEEKIQQTMQELGLLLVSDDKGRVYPAGRQASSLTDALRFQLARCKADIKLSSTVTAIKKQKGVFVITTQTEEYEAEKVVLCTGGKAAKNFGTDGTAYQLAQNFSHTVTKLYPSLVQLKTQTQDIKTFKGIRVSPAKVTAKWQGGERTEEGDIIFTDFGVSGDAIFKLSAFCTDKIENGAELCIDFLPKFSGKEIEQALLKKQNNFPDIPSGELLCGMLNNQIARAIAKRAGGKVQDYATLVKNFTLPITGTLGFDYAQVTKGGIPLTEVDENLQSKYVSGLYFAGEILDVDGQCGGYNLQWAYSSAMTVANAIRMHNAEC